MNTNRIIECVPNFSEGRNEETILYIQKAIQSVDGVKLLHVDPGKSTNRTVFTFAGSPEAVVEAAFQGIRAASEKIDMRTHQGEHPRMGATDVCPLVPISGISMEETVVFAKNLASRVGKELQIPVYLYEEASSISQRKNLADIRSGEYEGFEEKMKSPQWKPDYGPDQFNVKSGATVIGARDFLIAYNVNLNTRSTALANEIAFDIRENGRPVKDPKTNKIVKLENGEPKRLKGSCKSVKAIGWYIEEYGYAQVSMNITNVQHTPLHIAFEETRKAAEKYGVLVTGSELVGLIPKQSILDAGYYFLQKQKRSAGISDSEIIQLAIQSLGLHAVQIFEPKQRIIEDMIENKHHPLIDLSLLQFTQETASDSPAPGGGSVSAYVGSLGAALGTMVANLSAHKKGYEDQFDFFNEKAKEGQTLLQKLLQLVDEDTKAFNAIMEAYRLPKTNKEEKQFRKNAIQKANGYAIDIPFKTLSTAAECLNLLKSMAEKGNPNSVSDAGVGAICIEAAAKGAALNVLINAKQMDDEKGKEDIVQRTIALEMKVKTDVQDILQIVRTHLT